MSRLNDKFAALKADGKTAFVTYTMSGDPDPATSLEIMRGLPGAGVDIIELGLPFTDPMADGPSIQKAALRALDAGQTLKGVLAMAAAFREDDQTTPIILMGYYNPIYSHGVAAFLADAKAAGIDGLIVVDLPPEEDGELCLPANEAGLHFIRLATPTTDDRRLPAVAENQWKKTSMWNLLGVLRGLVLPGWMVMVLVAVQGWTVTMPTCLAEGWCISSTTAVR